MSIVIKTKPNKVSRSFSGTQVMTANLEADAVSASLLKGLDMLAKQLAKRLGYDTITFICIDFCCQDKSEGTEKP